MASSKPASGRRGPSQGAKKASGGVLPPPVTFPVAGPVPRKIEPQECVVRCIGASADGVRVVVLPREVIIRDMLNQTYGPGGWGDTFYHSGSWWRCQIEVFFPSIGQYVRKDAGPLNLPTSDPDRMQENTSFLRAAAKWGFAEDVMELGPIALKTEQVPVMQNDKGKYYPAAKLTVDKFARAEDGHICMVQFALPDGKKVLWDEKA